MSAAPNNLPERPVIRGIPAGQPVTGAAAGPQGSERKQADSGAPVQSQEERVSVPPVMELNTLLCLLEIASKPNCHLVQWQPPPDFVHGLHWDVQTLRLNDLCGRAAGYIRRITNYKDETHQAKQERDEWKAAFERRQERIAWLENQCEIHEIADHEPDE